MWDFLLNVEFLVGYIHKSERTDAASASLYYYPRDSNPRAIKKEKKKNFCVFYVLKKGLKSANFPRIQTFSQIETLYGK